jgi:hypothetical protein
VGKAYLVASALSPTTVEDIEAAADDQWNEVEITAAGTATDLSLSGLAEGDYRLYAVNGDQQLSAPAEALVTVDDTAPSVQGAPDPLRLEVAGATDKDDTSAGLTVLDSDGTYAAYWQGKGAGNSNIYVQRYLADGSSVGSRIEAGASLDDDDATLVALGGGAFALAWAGKDNSGDESVYVQRFDAEGQEAGDRLKLDGRTDLSRGLSDSAPSIAALGNTGSKLAVAYAGWVPIVSNPKSSENAVIVQAFDLGEVGLSAINPKVVFRDGAYAPQVEAIGPAGAFVLAWIAREQDEGANTRDATVFLQRFNSSGVTLGDPVKLETPGNPTGNESGFQMAVLDNRVAVAFESQNSSSSADSSILVQIVSESGPVGDPVKLDGDASNPALPDADPQLALLGGSRGFVVTWVGRNSDDFNDTSIFVQKFDGDGVAMGEPLKLDGDAETASKDEQPQVVDTGTDGSFAVTWQGVDSEGDTSIFLQRFDGDGSRDGELQKFEALGRSDGNDASPQIAALGAESDLVLAWHGEDPLADGERFADLSVFLQQSTGGGQGFVVTDDFGPVTGELADGAITDDASLVLSGTTEAGAGIDVFNGDTRLGAATVTDTTWTYTAALVDGTDYRFNIKATDLAGNVSEASPELTITSDLTPPGALTLELTSDTGISDTDGLTNDARLTLSDAEDGAEIEYSTDGGTTWSTSFSPADGEISVIARQTNGAGSRSPASAPLSFTLDSAAPTVTITAVAYDADANTLTLTGANFGTITDDGTADGDDVRSRLDWSKIRWDVDGDGANPVTFTADDAASAVASAADTLTITLTEQKATALEGEAGFDPFDDNDTLALSAGFTRDGAGNASSADAFEGPAYQDPVVVFDLVLGVSSSHSERTFQEDVDYTIYVRVDSVGSTLNTVPSGDAAEDAAWGKWSGVENLGADDRIIFAGNESEGALKGSGGAEISRSNNGGFRLAFFTSLAFPQTSPAAGLAINDTGSLFRVGNGGRRSADLWTGNVPDMAALAGTKLTSNVLNTLPAGILTSQGLV